MRLECIKPNCHALHLDDCSILFSYETPVAALVQAEGEILTLFIVSKWYSTTTTRHINTWLERIGCNKDRALFVDPDYLSNLLE